MKQHLLIFFFLLGFTISGFSQKPAQADVSPAQKTASVRYYPNPASSVINLEFQSNYKPGYSVVVYNLMGKEVMNVKKLSTFTSLYLQSLFRGMYIFKLLNENGALLQSGKFQVVK